EAGHSPPSSSAKPGGKPAGISKVCNAWEQSHFTQPSGAGSVSDSNTRAGSVSDSNPPESEASATGTPQRPKRQGTSPSLTLPAPDPCSPSGHSPGSDREVL